MGVESTNEEVLRQIKKGSTTRDDLQACRLLKQYGIFSIIGHIVGLGSERWSTFATALRQLRHYDGDYLNAMYVTPHAWTPFARDTQGRKVVEPDQSRWDYRHQILAQERLSPWQLFLAVKCLELCFHLAPGRLWSVLRSRRMWRPWRQQLWVFRHIGAVWVAELLEFLLRPSAWSGSSAPRERDPLVAPRSPSATAAHDRRRVTDLRQPLAAQRQCE